MNRVFMFALRRQFSFCLRNTLHIKPLQKSRTVHAGADKDPGNDDQLVMEAVV